MDRAAHVRLPEKENHQRYSNLPNCARSIFQRRLGERHHPANRAAEGPKTVARWCAASSQCEPLEERIDLSTITANAASESIQVSRVRRIVIGPAGKA
jgi:hypothetical protein